MSESLDRQIGTIAFILLAITATMSPASANQNKCSVVLARNQQSTSANQNLSTQAQKSPYLDFVNFRYGHLQHPPTAKIGGQFISNFHFEQSALGDRVSASFYLHGNPFGIQGSPSTALLTTQRQSSPALTQNPYQLARDYVLAQYGNRLDEQSLSLVIRTILESPDLMKDVYDTAPRLAAGHGNTFELSNFDVNRYFWFKPAEHNELKPARVLDLHRYKEPEAFTILVEYISENNSAGTRVRNIIELTETEFATMVRDSKNSAAVALGEFLDSLSPLEFETTKLAAKLNIKLYGFSSLGRTPGQQNDRYVYTPQQIMNDITWMGIAHDIQKRWDISDLLTETEKAMPHFNIIDAFARLDASYVLNRFHSHDMEYMWAITEDGQLKIMPTMKIGNNLKPRILRLSSGRRIFAGGNFEILQDGSLKITKNSSNYQNIDSRWGSFEAFDSSNPHLNKFISAVFATQAQAKVSTINSEKASSYIYTKAESDGNASGYRRYQDYSSFESTGDDFADFVNNMFSRSGMRNSRSQDSSADRRLTWDLEKGFPLFLDKWMTATKLPDHTKNDQNTLIRWAHYVLQTDHTMKWDEIKKRIRKLNSRFHLAANSDNQAQEAQSAVNRAKEILEKVMQ